MTNKIKTYKEIEYIIYPHRGTFCAYVRLPDKHKYQKYMSKKKKILGKIFYIGYELMNIKCHGGLTFSRKIMKKNQDNFLQGFSIGSWIGWDYSHYGDATYLPGLVDGKKWTAKEVETECREVIKQIL